MARDVLGVVLVLFGVGSLLLSVLVGLFAVATSASHGGGALASDLLIAGAMATAGLACLVGGVVALIVLERAPGKAGPSHDA